MMKNLVKLLYTALYSLINIFMFVCTGMAVSSIKRAARYHQIFQHFSFIIAGAMFIVALTLLLTDRSLFKKDRNELPRYVTVLKDLILINVLICVVLLVLFATIL